QPVPSRPHTAQGLRSVAARSGRSARHQREHRRKASGQGPAALQSVYGEPGLSGRAREASKVMRNIIPFPDVSGIAEAAAQWLIKLDQGPLDRAQRGELEAWLNADSRHRDSIAHLARIWGQMDALNLLAQLFPLDAEPQSDPSPSRWRRHALFGCIGAAACAALIALPLLLSLPLPLLLKQAP